MDLGRVSRARLAAVESAKVQVAAELHEYAKHRYNAAHGSKAHFARAGFYLFYLR